MQVPHARVWSKWMGLALLVIVLDQLSKIYFNTQYQFGEMRDVIPGYFSFTLIYNPGAAFSFLRDAGGWQKYLFTLLALGVSAYLGWNIIRGRFGRLMNIAASFIMGGAIGNVIDRLAYGHVVDFILVHYQHSWYYPAFNLADSFICVGAVLMVLDSLKQPRAH
ncbi:signal peptidase II [Aquitalea pelogenes]|uniref:signal peptidase II n=1 Tax=Aquitalea pelogenes TaxID=1293573 RepID=UPI001EFBDA02|nr:signal peptidase II [Aquitalea pelogenes]